MSNPNNAVPVDPIKIPVKLPKIKFGEVKDPVKDGFIAALIIVMGLSHTRLIANSHSALVADKQYQSAHELLLVSGGLFVVVLGLFLGYILISKIKK